MSGRKNRFFPGFTLVELLIVSSLLSIVGISIFKSFSSGVAVWQRLTQESPAEDVGIFFEKISSDLRNSFAFSTIKFRGAGKAVSFPAIIRFHRDDELAEGIGLVSYAFDERSGVLGRTQLNYSQIYRKEKAEADVLARGVVSALFQYYLYDAARKEYFWTSSWQEEDEAFGFESVKEKNILPLAVRIEIAIKDAAAVRTFTRTVSIPVAHFSKPGQQP